MYNTIKMSHIHWIIIVFYVKIVMLFCSRVMNVGYLGDVYWGSGCVWVGVGLDWVESGFMGDVGEGLGVLYFVQVVFCWLLLLCLLLLFLLLL